MDDQTGLNPLEQARRAYISRNGHSAYIDMTNSRFDRADIAVPESLYREIYREWRREASYQPSGQGNIATRTAIAETLYHRDGSIPPEDIVLTAGSSVSYFLLFRHLSADTTRSGVSVTASAPPRVLLPAPGYPLFESIAEDAGLSVGWYHCPPEGGFLPDLDEIQRELSTGAKAVVVITPNNPSGVLLPPEMRRRIDAICREHEAMLIVDEVFATFRGSQGAPSGASAPDTTVLAADAADTPLTVRINGVSKMYAAPEIKLGWIAVTGGSSDARGILVNELDTRHDTYLTVSGYAEAAGRVLLGTRQGRGVREGIAGAVMAQHVVFDSTILEIPGIESAYRDGERGGIHKIVRIDPVVASERFGTIDDEAITCRVLEAAGVMLHPGYLYGMDDGAFGSGPWFVATVLNTEETVLRAGDRLRDLLV